MFGADRHTAVSIDGERFAVNGSPTHPGIEHAGHSIEGLLLNARMIQALFDDENPETRDLWAYPDTGEWDPERHTREFVRAIPVWQGDRLGHPRLDAVTIGFQGGRPIRNAPDQPWIVSGFRPDGSLKEGWLDRLELVLDRADLFGMTVILQYFYQHQDAVLEDEAAVRAGARNLTEWLLEREYTNVLIEVANECNTSYDHELLGDERVHELIELVQGLEADGWRYDVGASYVGAGSAPPEEIVDAADYVLLHGNAADSPDAIAAMIRETRDLPTYTPKPIVFNEDDHYGFEDEPNNMFSAIANGTSWGYFDPGVNNYNDGYQCPPVDWGINTAREQAFFEYAGEIIA